MRRLVALLCVSLLALALLGGCAKNGADGGMATIGEGVPTDGKPVFYEFFTQG